MVKRKLSVALLGVCMAFSVGLFTSCKDYDDDIDNLQEQVDKNGEALKNKSSELQSALDAAKEELAAAKSAAAAAQKSANQAIENASDAEKAAEAANLLAAQAKVAVDEAKVEMLEKTQKLIDDLKKSMVSKEDQDALKAEFDKKIAEINGALIAVTGDLKNFVSKDDFGELEEEFAKLLVKQESFDSALQLQQDILGKFEVKLAEAEDTIDLLGGKIATLDELLGDVDVPQLKDQVESILVDLNDLQKESNSIKSEIEKLYEGQNSNGSKIEALQDLLKEEVADISNVIAKTQKDLNTLTYLLSGRLTSLVFSPSTYINGIEAINFATLQYNPWKNPLADEAGTTKVSTVNDGKTIAYYFANPSSVLKDNVKELSVLTQKATNTITRASEKALITATLDKIESGKLVVNLKKETEAPFTTKGKGNKEEFTVMALQAKVELTEAEKSAGISPYVTSDFARLSETPVIPYIHNVEAKTEKDAVAHFYSYSEIVDKKEGPSTTAGKFILKSLEYDNTLDLNTLVEVCDKEGNTYLAEDYGLAFEFDLVDYNLQDNVEEMTNQKEFAKIDEDGVISSRSRNGKPNNKDAVGREPLVQVILRNEANKEIVDVRYFKVKWTGKSLGEDLGNLQEFTDKFGCDSMYTYKVGTKEMNDKIYTVVDNETGISKDDFHALYTLDSKVYKSLEDAEKGEPASNLLGVLNDIVADGSTHTHNIEWELGSIEITEDEYKAGKAIRTVFGRFVKNNVPSEFFTFNLVVEVKIDQMAFDAGYNSTYWNTSDLKPGNVNKSLQVNPALTDDSQYGLNNFFDCQIISDILSGYNKADIAKLTSALELVSNADAAQFVFDEKRLSILGADWKVSKDETQLLKGNVVAAEIIEGSIIKLYENPLPTVSTHGKPTDPAQELLGKSVPVKLSVEHCSGIKSDVDYFLINFISPLKMELSDVEDSFKDLMTGGSKISVDKIATITEKFGFMRPVWEDGAEVKPEDGSSLVQWYNVEGVTWDVTKATTNLKIEGNNIIITDNPEASKWSDFADKYKLEAKIVDGNTTELIFKNNSGAHIQQAFKIAVPVYVKTKWSPTLYDAKNTIVVLSVEQGDYE